MEYFISPQEAKEKLSSSTNGYLFVDIREANEYNDWSIKGSINVPINPLIVAGNFLEIKENLKNLPKDKSIVTICARGLNSQVAAEILRDMGYNAVTLEKGMKGWNENFDIYKIEFDGFDLVQFVRVGKGCLSYIVYSHKEKSSAVFEPSIFTDEYVSYIKANDLKVKYVIDTHAHADHFSGAMELAKKLNVPYSVNSADVDNVFSFNPIDSSKSISLGDVEIKILNTPGHTDGSLSFLINNQALICGDLLLLESPGRPDLARSKEETINGAGILFNTLQDVILKLDDNVKIFPAHFTKTQTRPVTITLGDMKKSSHAISINDKDKFIEYLTSNIPMTPPNYDSIKKYNKAGVIIPVDYAEELEIGPNRCTAR